MVFSWDQVKKDAIAIKIRRAKTMARMNVNPDFAVRHPQEVSQAQNKNYTELIIRIKKEVQKAQDMAQARRDRRAGK